MEAKDWEKTVISWERIRMVLHEQDKKGTTDNMFRLEAIAQAQARSSDKEWWRLLERIRVHLPKGYLSKYITFQMKREEWQALKQKVEEGQK